LIEDAAADRAAAARSKVFSALKKHGGSGALGSGNSSSKSKAAMSKRLADLAAADPEGWTISSRNRQATYHPYLFAEAERLVRKRLSGSTKV
jgi:hypothetical protein